MIDYTIAAALVIAGASAVAATAYGALPERIDITFVFAAYGAGTIVGELLGARGARGARARRSPDAGASRSCCPPLCCFCTG